MILTRALAVALLSVAAASASAAEQVFLVQTQETLDVAAPCPDQNIKLGA